MCLLGATGTEDAAAECCGVLTLPCIYGSQRWLTGQADRFLRGLACPNCDLLYIGASHNADFNGPDWASMEA